jgi:hypothetical protein
MGGTPLSYHFSGASTMSFVVPPTGAEFSIQLARSFTHLKTLIITFYADAQKPAALTGTTYGVAPNDYVVSPTVTTFTNAAEATAAQIAFANVASGQAAVDRYDRMKESTHFLNPSLDALPQEFECQVVMGAKVFPVMPIKGNTQAYYNLRKALSQTAHGYTDISYKQFISDSFILPLNLEKARFGDGASHAAFSGLSSMGGETMQIMFKGITGTLRPRTVWVTLLFDAALNVRADGCEVSL